MSRRGPDPKDLRASVVDSGWSVAPPETDLIEPEDPSTRRLPSYDDPSSQAPAVTRVDTDIQARLRAMQRRSLADSPVPSLPPPPPARASRPPPSLPPPPPPTLPPRASKAPLPSFVATAAPDTEPRLPAYPAPRASDAEAAEPTEVLTRGDVLPPSDPPAPKAAAPRQTPPPPPAPAAPPPLAVAPAPWPAFAPAPLPAFSQVPPQVVPSPSLLSALAQRVRFAGGEVPLWSLLTPMVVLLALGSAFAAAALGTADSTAIAPPVTSASASASAPSAPSLPSSQPSPREAPPAATTATPAPALPASSIDTEALEARRAEELSKDEALALASARRLREVSRFATLRSQLSRDPGLFKDPATLGELRRAGEDPLTAPDALSAMAEAPGPLGADLLYEMWTGTVARNSATELARSLVFSKEVRAKASPALSVALDLRIAETCEQNRELLPKVVEHGDRRALALLAKLARKFGCGPNKRLDCYPCLREEPKAVDDAMTAVKKRREPKPFSGK